MVKQHIVPKFYLTQFATKTKKNGTYKIKAFNKNSGKEIRPPIDRIALQKNFYDKEEPPIFENTLAFLENHASKVYHKILREKSIISLSDKERTIFSHFIFIQYTRTQASRELFRQVYDLLYEDSIRTKNYPKKNEFDGSYPLYLKDRAFLAQLKIMFDPNIENDKLLEIPIEASKKIFNLTWKLLKNDNKLEFYSSDHPVLLYDPDSDGKTIKGYGIYTFQTPRVEMYFPLNPHLCLVMLGENTQKYVDEEQIININAEDLEWINRQIVAESYQFVFTKSNSFDYVKYVLEYYPELRNINRNRIYI